MCNSINCGTNMPKVNVKMSEGSLHASLAKAPKQKLFGTYYDEGPIQPSQTGIELLDKLQKDINTNTINNIPPILA